jgi:ABC-type transport system substrate-binding protein
MAQGIVSKKYVETVGEEVAARKPMGTGPYKLVESKSASYFKFEAVENHWRVVPEFKTLTIRMVPEISTTVAMLKTKEIDLAIIPAEQMADLKAAGVATEASSVGGGGLIIMAWGGLVIPEDDRYDASYHNKDPWVDVRVRKAMSLAIDRQAICDTIFAGGAIPAAVPLHSANMDTYHYPYDPASAKQLLVDAGYPNGFSFEAISYKLRGSPETPRVVEALVGYWQQIGLDPKIVVADLDAYSAQYRNTLRNAGKIALNRNSPKIDMLDVAGLQLMPGGMVIHYQDEASYAIWKEGITKVSIEERDAYVDKLNQYYYEKHYGPLCNISQCFAWNSAKISPFPHSTASSPKYLEYVRHAEPLNTFRLFTPFPGR